MVQCQHEITRGANEGSVCTKKAIQSGEHAGKYCASHARQFQNKELREQARKENPKKFASGKGVSTAYSVYMSEKAKEWKALKASKDQEDQARVKEYGRLAQEKNEEKNSSSSSSEKGSESESE